MIALVRMRATPRASKLAMVATALLAALLLAAPALAGGEESPARAGGGASPAQAGAEPAPALPPCADAAVRKLQERYEQIRDFRASFEQATRSVALGATASRASQSRGTVVFAKPGKMRWTYESPEPSEVVSDGRTLWIYDPARKEVQRLEVGEAYISGAAIQFLLGEGDMRRDFRIRETACEETGVELELTPIAPASYEKLEVRADPRSGDLRMTRIHDLVGNVTEVAFDDIRVNQAPPETTFTFDVPDGVRVITP